MKRVLRAMTRSSISSAKERVIEAADLRDAEMRALALLIHQNPEQGHREFLALKWLTEPLKAAGCVVEYGIAGLETAFKATWKACANGPHVAFLAEYDALPEIGHACGHNIIGAAAVGAMLALKDALPDLPATVSVIGTPAEETDGGKVTMAEKGVFADIDAALMIHPARANVMGTRMLACVDLVFKFGGRASHASSAPEYGISALDAVIGAFGAINSLRQFIPETNRVHGIITKGGDAPNIVPHYCEAAFMLRSPELAELEQLKRKVVRAAEAAAHAVGATFECVEGVTYADFKPNDALGGLFSDNMKTLGVEMQIPTALRSAGSSDIGNVSQKTAAIHPYISLSCDAANHTREFGVAAGSEKAMLALNLGIKALAMTAVDLCLDTKAFQRVRAEFGANVAGQPQA